MDVQLSNAVKNLVAGSGLAFTSRGSRAFADLPGEWRLFVLE
jgi:hypothetical protein